MTRVNGDPNQPAQSKRGLRNLNTKFDIEAENESLKEPERKRAKKTMRKIAKDDDSEDLYEGGHSEDTSSGEEGKLFLCPPSLLNIIKRPESILPFWC